MPRKPVALVCLACFLAALSPLTAGADEQDKKIEKLVKDAKKAYDAGDCKKSAETLQRAYEIKALPKLLFNIASSFEKCEDEEQSIRYYERYVDAGEDTALVRRASKALERLKQQRDVRLAEDKKKQEEEAKKSEQARREAEEAKASAAKAEADARAREDEARRRPAATASQSGPRMPSPWAFGVSGVAVAGLATGITFGVLASNSKSEYDATTDYDLKSNLRTKVKQRALIADISFAVAVAAAAGATVLFVLTTRSQGPGSAQLSVGPAGVAVSGTWGP